MIRQWQVLPITLLLLATSVLGFDGKRTGFVLGGGAGLAPVASTSLSISGIFHSEDIGCPSIKVDEAAAGLSLCAGYGLSEQNIFVFEGNLVRYTSDPFYERTVVQGFCGPVWYHYTEPNGRSLFAAIGIGLYFFDIEGFDSIDPGFGFMIGGGIEFARHFQAGGYYSHGRSSAPRYGSDSRVDIEYKHLSVLLSAMAF